MDLSRKVTFIAFFFLLCEGALFCAKGEEDSFDAHLETIYAGKRVGKSDGLEDYLWGCYHDPLDLNSAQERDLAQFTFLSKKQQCMLFDYLEREGPLVSLNELQAIRGWDVDTIQLLSPFVDVIRPWWWKVRSYTPIQEASVYFARKQGGEEKGKRVYLGSDWQLLMRYFIRQPGVYEMAFVGSKAPYEPFFLYSGRSMQLPLGYYGGYCALEGMGGLQKVVLGDYQVALGQGLVVGDTFSIGGGDVIGVFKASHRGVKANKSFQRKKGFRGVACSLKEKDHEVVIYGSRQKLDATIWPDEGEGDYVQSIGERGIAYTTEGRLEKRGSLQEDIVGGAYMYRRADGTIYLGMQALYHGYDKLLDLGKEMVHDCFFRGKENMNLGLFANGMYDNYHFFGEIACDQGDGLGVLAGMMAAFGRHFDASFLSYYYGADFHSLYGSSYGRSGRYNRNKAGLYVGLQYRANREFLLKSYMDMSRHIIPHARLHEATHAGYKCMVSARYKPRRDCSLTLQVKGSDLPHNGKGSRLESPLIEVWRKAVPRLKALYTIKEGWQGGTVVEGCLLNVYGGEEGRALLSYGRGIKQLVYYKGSRLGARGWISLYDTSNYNSAVRFYSHNLRGMLFYPALYGKNGMELGMQVRYRLGHHWRLGIQVGFNHSIYNRDGSKGSGGRKKNVSMGIKVTYKV